MSASPSSNEGKGRKTAEYGRGAGLLSVGIGVTGLVTFAFFFLASHTLTPDEYGEISLLWSVVFVVVSVLYRPIEQLLARTVAERDAAGESLRRPLEVAATIQLGLGLLFAVVALVFREPLEDELFGGDAELYWIMVSSVLAYAASYFGRGLLAGGKRFGLYGLLVFVEATSRVCFALAVALGIASGQTAVALGVLAAPLLSLVVVPLALVRRGSRAGGDTPDAIEIEAIVAEESQLDAAASSSAREEADFTLAHGGGFAAAALLIMLAEQTFLNAGPLIVKATGEGAALAGIVFNVLLIARAPLQLFQSVSTSLLPHLSTLRAAGDVSAYRHGIRVTLLAITAFAAAAALVLLIAGPALMHLLFGDDYDYERFGLVLVACGMGLYLAAATLNQSALAARRTVVAAGCWTFAAVAFVAWLLIPAVDDPVWRIEIGFAGAAALLCASLAVVYVGTMKNFAKDST